MAAHERFSLDEAPLVPVQWPSYGDRRKSISERIARMAYVEYGSRYSQSFERLHERGGFGAGELIMLLAERVAHLEAENATLRKRIKP